MENGYVFPVNTITACRWWEKHFHVSLDIPRLFVEYEKIWTKNKRCYVL